MKLKNKAFDHIAYRVSQVNLARVYRLKDDDRPSAPYKLVYFCGAGGINYLNASLISVYKSWTTIPELVIMTDGTPVSAFTEQMIKWPRAVQIISWEKAEKYYRNKGNRDLSDYAVKALWGKKLISILFLAEHYDVVYSDSDVLWFNEPTPKEHTNLPYIKMGHDVGIFYDYDVINALEEEHCLDVKPLNAGLIRIHGDFSVYPKWKLLCKTLNEFHDGVFAEQTTFAILANHFNKKAWTHDEVLIKLGDQYHLRNSKKAFPAIMARHYVSEKTVTFWKDFAFTALKR